MKQHSKLLPTDGVHMPLSWIVADATNRLAVNPSLVAADRYKFCYQTDTKTVYFLTQITPTVTWEVILTTIGAISHAGLGDLSYAAAGHTGFSPDTHDHALVYEAKNANIQSHVGATGNPHSTTKADIGLSNVDDTTDLLKPLSTATTNALSLKANAANPAFTGTATGLTKAMVGLSNVDNTTDLLKPLSTATTNALSLKANAANPAFTGTATGLTKAMVGLSNVDDTTDLLKPLSTATTNALAGKLSTGLKGTINGLAELDSNGLVPSTQLPSYVDDVLEYANLAAFPGTGVTGKIYVALDTNITYRWSGTVYVIISATLALGVTSATAYRGDYGNTAYTHSQVVTGNPHGTTKADLSLGSVDNTTDLLKPISNATQTALNAKENTITVLTVAHGGTGVDATSTVAARVFASPAGATGAPSFRALAATDIPAIATSGVTGLDTALGLKAPLASPTFSGTPSLPTGTVGITQTAGTNNTTLATTAFVAAADALKANLASPTFTGTPSLPTGTVAVTQAAGNNTTAVATTAFVAALGALKANLVSPSFTTPALGTPTSGVLSSCTGLTVAGGGTGATTAAGARTNLGLGFYDMAGACIGKPAAGAKVWVIDIPRAVTIPAGLSGTTARAVVGATVASSFQLWRAPAGGAASDTTARINFAAGGQAGTQAATFSGLAALLNCAAGDILYIVAPASQDATLSDIAWTIAGVY